MANFQVEYPDALVSRTLPRIRSILEGNESAPVIQKILTHIGVANVGSLSGEQAASVFAAYQLWKVMRDGELAEAVENANLSSTSQSVDDFAL